MGAGAFTTSVAWRITPSSDAVNVTCVDDCTAFVDIGASADDDPLGTCTDAATVATPVLPLESVTVTPPAGAAPDNVTRSVEPWPPLTGETSNCAEVNVGAGAFTVNVACRATPANEAVSTTGV